MIAIIGVLTSMSLMVLADAANSSNASRTKVQIRKINNYVMDRWESYETRQIRLNRSQSSLPSDPKDAAQVRLYALRVLMRMELPDRMSDIIGYTDQKNLSDNVDENALESLTAYYKRVTDSGANPIVVPSPGFELPTDFFDNALNDFYFDQVVRAVVATNNNPNNGVVTWEKLLSNQSSECLYLILLSAQDEYGNGTDFFSDSEIGDTDDDGLYEILDAWGTPINFLRWAPGLSENTATIRSPAQPGTVPDVPDPDPFDPLRSDPRLNDEQLENDTFRLVPLIVSAGTDREFGIWFRDDFDHLAFDNSNRLVNYTNPSPDAVNNIVNDPFWGWGLAGGIPSVGFPLTGYVDNVDNHFGLER